MKSGVVVVRMARNGENVVGIDLAFDSDNCEYKTPYFLWRHPRHKPEGEYLLFWPVRTSDVKRAIKVVDEKRVQLLAMNAWGNDDILAQLKGAADAQSRPS